MNSVSLFLSRKVAYYDQLGGQSILAIEDSSMAAESSQASNEAPVDQALGRSKGGFGIKIYVLVDALEAVW